MQLCANRDCLVESGVSITWGTFHQDHQRNLGLDVSTVSPWLWQSINTIVSSLNLPQVVAWLKVTWVSRSWARLDSRIPSSALLWLTAWMQRKRLRLSVGLSFSPVVACWECHGQTKIVLIVGTKVQKRRNPNLIKQIAAFRSYLSVV